VAKSSLRELLLEIGTEELPPGETVRLAQALAGELLSRLQAAELVESGEPRWYVSPRRLAVRLPGLRQSQPERQEERLGPAVAAAFGKDGKPSKAAEGFARSCGVSIDQLERRQTDKGERLAHTRKLTGETAISLLPGLISESLDALPCRRRMRWGAGEFAFPRPVHWVLCLLGGELVPGNVYGVEIGRWTRGHRFHAPDAIEIRKPVDYPARLEKKGRVKVEDASGGLCREIRRQVEAVATGLKGKAVITDALLAEVAGLVEWPVALAGGFDRRFLTLPEEVLISSLAGHQRYFAVRDGKGGLLPYFITVSNVDSRSPDAVRTGNERVIGPRLQDAIFFWDTDRAHALETRVDALDAVTFQRGLGSLGDKRRRVERLAGWVADAIGADREASMRAARLARCDLLTEMVGEFPELQGVMGGYYAEANGEPAAVFRAIGEQYLPVQAGDALPDTPEGTALAVADRIDTLVGSFAIGQRPTGNKDPFALRRTGLGLMRILVEKALDLDLDLLVREAAGNLSDELGRREGLEAEVFDFLMERLRAWYLDRGVEVETFEAVRAVRPARPADFDARLSAVTGFLGLDAAESLAAANKRIGNILRKASEDGEHPGPMPRITELEAPAEIALAESLAAVQAELDRADGYTRRLEILARLRDPVDRFFDEVMVMSEEAGQRRRRLGLLKAIHAAFMEIADISRLRAA
jgi:glycyl-tRNA synthetase beta chain